MKTVIAVGKGDEGFDVSPDGRELWTDNAQDGSLSIIDLAGKKVTDMVSGMVSANCRMRSHWVMFCARVRL
jgi:DNA-binding beta-propeller fold protein YncE